jgi:hypothetical protein
MWAAFCSWTYAEVKWERERSKKISTTGTNLIPAEGKRSKASIKAEPTIPKHELTLFATSVSTNASEFDILTLGAGLVEKDFIAIM